MSRIDFFRSQVNTITNPDYRNFVNHFLETKVGDWFWESGASSTGKYHPQFTKGQGGLVRHSVAVCMMCNELMNLSTYDSMSEDDRNLARVACLLHDTYKYGGMQYDRKAYKMHGALAAQAVENAWLEMFHEPVNPLLTSAIRSHMGQWTNPASDRPKTLMDNLVHLSDYILSRSMLDSPCVVADYQMIESENELPF